MAILDMILPDQQNGASCQRSCPYATTAAPGPARINRRGIASSGLDLKDGQDVRLFRAVPGPVRGVLAAPPCTAFARSGARWWAVKGDAALLDGLAVVDACLRIVQTHQPRWWALENPVGRLQDYLGPPFLRFHPWEYGDPWTKRTWLWGRFVPPARSPVQPAVVNWVESVNGRDRQYRRSVTPDGFAHAFFAANP